MKNTAIIITLVILLSALAYMVVLRAPERPTYRATYLVDRTDTFEVNPSVSQKGEAFSWNAQKQERSIRIRRITDVVSEEVLELNLGGYRILGQPQTWELDRNDIARKKEVEAFVGEVNEALGSIMEEPIGRNHSAILEPLVEELLLLQQYPEDDNHVFLFSDMGQNTYQHRWVAIADTIRMLEADDESLWYAIDGVDELENMSGTHLHIIHKSSDSKSDMQFRIRARYVRKRLMEYGAKVSIHGGVQHIKN